MTQREEMETVGPRLGGGRRLDGFVTRFVLSDGDSVLWRDERFVEWLARRVRKRAERKTPPAREADGPASGRTASLRGACSRRFGVRVYEAAPASVDAAAGGELVALELHDDGMFPFLRDGDTVLVATSADVRRDAVVVVRMRGGGLACRRVCRVTRGGYRVDRLVPAAGSATVATRSTIVGRVVAAWSTPAAERGAPSADDCNCRLI